MTMAPELRKSLLKWAEQTGGEDLQQKMAKQLTEYTSYFDRTHSLWARVCGHHSSETGSNPGSAQEPTLEWIVQYLTFNELCKLIQSLCPKIFPNWSTEKHGRQPPAKSWPAHLARLGRLRNESAHLRNVTFQDMEDLLKTTREMRRDMREYL